MLVELSKVLKETCRNIDLVGRFGGEEFCIIFPGTDDESAEIIGERVVNAVRHHRFQNNLTVTVSMGIAVLPAENKMRAWTPLIKEADAALYKAKASGRNQFCMSSAASPRRVDGVVSGVAESAD